MFEHISRGLLINYTYLVEHFQSLSLFFLIAANLIFIYLFIRVFRHQQQLHMDIAEQQTLIEHLYEKLHDIFSLLYDCRYKQKIMSKQLTKVDDSLYELEDRMTVLKDAVLKQMKISRDVLSDEHHQFTECGEKITQQPTQKNAP